MAMSAQDGAFMVEIISKENVIEIDLQVWFCVIAGSHGITNSKL
jgi:hypothetical protein